MNATTIQKEFLETVKSAVMDYCRDWGIPKPKSIAKDVCGHLAYPSEVPICYYDALVGWDALGAIERNTELLECAYMHLWFVMKSFAIRRKNECPT